MMDELLEETVDPTPPLPDLDTDADPQAVELVVDFAGALHAAGAPAHRLEAIVDAVAAALGLRVAVFAQPTSVYLDLEGRTRMLRVEPQGVSLRDLVAIDHLARKVEARRVGPAQARQALARLLRAAPPYGRPAELAAWMGVAGAAAVFFGGGAVEVLLSALLSLLVGLVPARLGALLPIAAAIGVGLSAHAAAAFVPLRADVVLLSGLIVLLPGFTLTTGLTELATRHLSSGSARLAAAGVTFLQLGVGIGLADALGARLLPAALPAAPIPLGPLAQALAVAGAALSSVVHFRARWQDLPAILVVAFVAVHGTRLGGLLLGPDAAPFLGALAVGLVANAHARLRDVPVLVALVPGMILLVPGSMGFRGVQALVEAGAGGAAGGGAGASLLDGARMFVVGASLVAGVLTANTLIPPRRAL